MMTDIEELKNQLQHANEEASKPLTKSHDIARRVIDIERQSIYGEKSMQIRLGAIRKLIAERVKDIV